MVYFLVYKTLSISKLIENLGPTHLHKKCIQAKNMNLWTNKPFCKKSTILLPHFYLPFSRSIKLQCTHYLWPKWQAKTEHHSNGRPEVWSYHQIIKTCNYSMLKWKFQGTGTLACSNWPINMYMLQDYITYTGVFGKKVPHSQSAPEDLQTNHKKWQPLNMKKENCL